MKLWCQWIVGMLVSGGLVGCGMGQPKADIVDSVPASGVITYKGQPLENYQVTFFPADGGRPASGKSNSEGRFTLGTNGPDDGALPGKHKVAVTFDTTAISGEPGKEEYKPPPPPKVRIPEKYFDPEKSGLTQEIPPSGTSDLKIDLQ